MRPDMIRTDRRTLLAGLTATALAPRAAIAEPPLPLWRRRPVARPSGNAPYLMPDGRIRIVGTDIMRNLIEAWNHRFAGAHPGFAFDLQMRPGLMAIGPAAYGITPFAPMPRRFTREELASFRTIAGRDPVVVRVAHGSVVARDRTAVLAIYVHRANPIRHLTMDQVGAIFSTGHPGGDISCWGQLGLGGEWAARPIHPVGTPLDAGFGSYLSEEKMGGRPLSPSMTIRAISSEVMAVVGGDIGAIGYAAINFANDSTRELPIGVGADGPWLTGTAADVMAGRYALDRFIYLYALPRPDGTLDDWIEDYFQLALSREGQALVAAETDSFLPLLAGNPGSDRGWGRE